MYVFIVDVARWKRKPDHFGIHSPRHQQEQPSYIRSVLLTLVAFAWLFLTHDIDGLATCFQVLSISLGRHDCEANINFNSISYSP
jgi:hypothetical protein